MASALETAKLITASYLHRFWENVKWLSKAYLISALVILMGITSLGIYGFLVSAYQETAYNVQEVDQKIALHQNKKNRFESQLKTISAETQSLNKNIAELTTGLSNNKIQRRDRNGNIINTTSGSTRRALEKQLDNSINRRDTIAVKEYALTDSVNKIDLKILDLQTNSEAAAEIGPLKYVAKITGKDIDKIVNWFILLFIIVFDPLAVILLISAQHSFKFNNTKNIYGETKNYFKRRNKAINKIINKNQQMQKQEPESELSLQEQSDQITQQELEKKETKKQKTNWPIVRS